MEASLWTRCMGALEAELPEQQFNTWVRPLQAMEGNGALKLLAPNRFVVDWVNANLLPRIGELLRDESTGDVPIVTVEVGSRSAAQRQVAAAVREAGRALTTRSTEGSSRWCRRKDSRTRRRRRLRATALPATFTATAIPRRGVPTSFALAVTEKNTSLMRRPRA